MTSFSSWREVNIAQSESTASNLKTTWDAVWPDPRIRDVFIFNCYWLYPASVLWHSLKTQVNEKAECDYTFTYTHITHSKTTHQGMTPSLQPYILIQCRIV